MALLSNYKIYMATLARRAAKTLLFVALFGVFARVIDAYALSAWIRLTRSRAGYTAALIRKITTTCGFLPISLPLRCARLSPGAPSWASDAR